MLSVLPEGLSINPSTAAKVGGKISYPRYSPSVGMLLVSPLARVPHGYSSFIWVYTASFAFNLYQSEIYT